jgi:hypothetical protein
MSKKNDWEKRLSHAAKAEMLTATFHLLTDHMPEVWRKVPAWLRAQIKQAMADCSIEYKEFAEDDLKTCNEYGQWLNEKHPQPGSTLAALLKKRRKKKKHYLHFAFISKSGNVGQYGCAWGTSLADVKKNTDPREHGDLVRMKMKDCPLCKEDKK